MYAAAPAAIDLLLTGKTNAIFVNHVEIMELGNVQKTCQAVSQLETLPAGTFSGRPFASLMVLLCTLLISLKKKASEDISENT